MRHRRICRQAPRSGPAPRRADALEYRGYDSAGISVIAGDDDRVRARRRQPRAPARRRRRTARTSDGGAVAVATRPATTGIGHTRWATHGRVNEENAHPHFDTTGAVHVVVNGIVENYMALKERLIDMGAVFTSETDAEVIAHLISHHLAAGDLVEAVRAAYAELDGHFAFVAMRSDEPDVLVGARKECPLVVGLGEGETFLASAIPAFLRETRRVQFIENGEIVAITPEGTTFLLPDGTELEREIQEIDWDEETAEKGGYETFMLKEIHEQADAVAETIADRTLRDDGVDLDDAGALDEAILRDVKRVDRGRLRHELPRGPDRPLRARGVGADAGRDGHRLRVPLPQPGRRPRRPRHRHHAVRRDRRHARRHAHRPGARRDGPRHHEHHGLAGHARRRRRALHARRPRGRRWPRRRRSSARSPSCTCSACASPSCAARSTPRAARRSSPTSSASRTASRSCWTASSRTSTGSPSSAGTRSSSSTSAATSACRSRSRARSSSRRSPTSRPTPTPRAR